MRKLLILGIALSTLGLIAPAYGDAVLTDGVHHQPNEQNILFSPGVTGMTITGTTNHSDTVVDFTSTTTTLTSKGGQADIDGAMHALIQDLTMTVPGHTFLDAIFNPFKPGHNDDLIVTVVTNTGTTVFPAFGSSHGNNFFTVTATSGQVIDSVTVDSASGFQSLGQPRISGISGVAPIPEPSTFLLVGSGLLAFLLIQKKRRLVSFET